MAKTFSELEDKACCSCHTFFMNGCADCKTADDYKEHTTKLEKSVVTVATQPLVINPRELSPKVQLITQQLARMLAVFFSGAAKSAATAAGKKAKEFTKINKKDEEDIALAAYLAIEWDQIVDSAALTMMAAYQAGALEAAQQLNITLDDEVVNKAAVDYANSRAAEMIGKQYIDEKLEDYPAAKYVIAETTKDDLLDVIEEAAQEELSIAEMQEQIVLARTFSDLRSQFISKNEIAVAATRGHLDIWRNSTIVTKVNVVLSDSHPAYDLCDELAENSPYDIENVPVIPSHPYCMCSLFAVEIAESITV